MKTIVAFVDFSDTTEPVVAQAQALAKAFQARLILIHGVPLQPDMVDLGIVSPAYFRQPTAEEWSAHQAKLIALRDSLSAAGVDVTAEQFQNLTLQKMLSELGRLNVDLVIVGAHPHSVWYELFIGSMTRDVLKYAPCPVLVVPAAKTSAS